MVMVFASPLALAVVMAAMRHATSPAGHAKSAAWLIGPRPTSPRSSTRLTPRPRRPAPPRALPLLLILVNGGCGVCIGLPPVPVLYTGAVRPLRGPPHTPG